MTILSVRSTFPSFLNPAALETAADVERMVFDTTGTLTAGKMSVVAVQPAPGIDISPEKLLSLAAITMAYSSLLVVGNSLRLKKL